MITYWTMRIYSNGAMLTIHRKNTRRTIRLSKDSRRKFFCYIDKNRWNSYYDQKTNCLILHKNPSKL